MKRFIPLLILCFIMTGCRQEQSSRVLNSFADRPDVTDTTLYPLFIDDGAKIVYKFGHLTADKGLKLYFDTIPHPAEGLHLDDSVRRRLSVERPPRH